MYRMDNPEILGTLVSLIDEARIIKEKTDKIIGDSVKIIAEINLRNDEGGSKTCITDTPTSKPGQ